MARQKKESGEEGPDYGELSQEEKEARNIAPPRTTEDEAEGQPKKSKREQAEEEETKKSQREITLRIRERDGTISDEEADELEQINEKAKEETEKKRLGKE